ncbi:host attachment family protein [Pararhizobium mangrovi]|uniref:Host attachment protein n=1 Tax=Pararhizobium mangrovi TaxID=2590452 RepID=A0A506UHD3_9HYPH|nr:host attachment family protein [Pararhizobium mangrovi]TPW32724.1 host attachment protein [Pararhizobium mangrovi]
MKEEISLKNEGWVVVADGEKALFLVNDGDELHPNLRVFRDLEQDNPPDRDQGTDKPGRSPNTGPSHSSAVQETDWHRLEKERFAKGIAERLYKQAHKGKFSSLVLTAPPQVLGDLRKELHSEVSDRIVAEVAKDLTHHTVDRIEKLLLRSDD